MRDAAHRHAVAGGEGEIEQLRAGLGVLEKHLVEIAEPEQQQRIGRIWCLMRRYCCIMGVSPPESGWGFALAIAQDYSDGRGLVTPENHGPRFRTLRKLGPDLQLSSLDSARVDRSTLAPKAFGACKPGAISILSVR